MNHPQPDAEQLFDRWRGGDRSAYDRLFAHFYPALCHYAVLLGLETAEGEEVVQDCFFKLWQRRTDLEQVRHIGAYLYTAVKHASINRQKMIVRKLHREHQYFETQPDAEDAPDYQLMEAEVLAELQHAIRNLPPQCGTVVWLSYMDGLSGKEIAERLGVTVSTVNNQKARGIKLLRDRMKRYPQNGIICVAMAGIIATLQA